MRFVVYGAGAIGGVIAARLFQAGPVMLITRGAPAHRGTGQRRRIVLAESDTAGGQHRDRLSQWRDRAPGAPHWRPHAGERAALPACQSAGAARQPTGARGARRCAGPVRPNCLSTLVTIQALKPRLGNALEEDKLNLFARLGDSILRKRSRIEAFEYLNTWGKNFWTTTEERIKETTVVIERELSAKAGLDTTHVATLQAGGTIRLTEQQTKEVKKRGEEIVNEVQMSQLSALLDALDEDILTDPQQRYYILVDHLDEQWVDERYRHRLIRGLIETVRDMNSKVRHLKIIVALRSDLINRVYKATSDSGFQEEKYVALNLPVSWTRQDLQRLLDTRVQSLVRQRYTQQPVRLQDILPVYMGRRGQSQLVLDYLLERTLLRPRDAIQFLNVCLEQAIDEPTITVQMILKAEAEYSQKRRTALADEWSFQFPNLILLSDLLKGRLAHFALRDIRREELEEICLVMLSQGDASGEGIDRQPFQDYYDNRIDERALRSRVAQWLYMVGFVGLKLGPSRGILWSATGPVAVNSAEVDDDTTLYVHPAFWRVLGTKGGTAS
jgi:hypothetical protein